MKNFGTFLFLSIALSFPACASAGEIWGPDSQSGGPAQSCGIFEKGHLDCSATVVAPDIAMTAAHCFADPVFLNTYLKCGEEGRRYRVWRMQPHPEFTTRNGYVAARPNDMMLVYLDKELAVDGNAEDFYDKSKEGEFSLSRSKGDAAEKKFAPEPIPLAPAGTVDIPTSNADCIIAGWGHDTGPSKGDTGAPRQAKVYKLDYDPAWPDKTVIRVGFEGNSAAHGDSGGGLLCRKNGEYYLVGVISGSYGEDSALTAITKVMGRF